jgi:hypothetical protein
MLIMIGVDNHLQNIYAPFDFDADVTALDVALAGHSDHDKYPSEFDKGCFWLTQICNAGNKIDQWLKFHFVTPPKVRQVAEALLVYKTSRIEAISTLLAPLKMEFRAFVDENGWPTMWKDLNTLVAVLVDESVTLPVSPSQHERDLPVQMRHTYSLTWTELSKNIFIGWSPDRLEQVYTSSTSGWIEQSRLPSELQSSMAGWSDGDLITIAELRASHLSNAVIARTASRPGTTMSDVAHAFVCYKSRIEDLLAEKRKDTDGL